MSAQSPQTSETRGLFASLLETLEARAAGPGPLWMARLRQEAARRVRDKGLPSNKEEAWRPTPLAPLTRIPFAPCPTAGPAPAWLADVRPADGHVAVLFDGQAVTVPAELPRGVTVRALSEVLAEDPELVQAGFDRHVARGRPFPSVNTALFEEGLVVHVGRGVVVEGPIHLVLVSGEHEAPTFRHPRILVVAEEGSEVRLVETHVGRGGVYLTSAVTEVLVEQGAQVDHVRVQEDGPEAFHLGTVAAHLDRDARYFSRVMSLGAAWARVDLEVTLDGEGAEAILDGVYVTGGSQHVDHHTVIDHAKPHCQSRERYRGILDGASRGVFDGQIVVRRDAQQTSAHQENRNLILSDDALANTKPSLVIDADDVKCSHGATIGQLDPEQLFYLRARGLDFTAARALLTWAFAREIVDRIPVASVRERVSEAVLARLPGGEAVRSLS